MTVQDLGADIDFLPGLLVHYNPPSPPSLRLFLTFESFLIFRLPPTNSYLISPPATPSV